ncbi:MAG: MATE family efflux transporter [bacterium]
MKQIKQHGIGRDLTEGSILGTILYMGIPSMIGFAAMVVYELTDMFWVSKLGTEQVAAITLFAAFAWVIGSINSLIGSGSVAVVSRRFGEKDFVGTRIAIEQTMAMKLLIGIPMGAVGFLGIRFILSLMTKDASVIDLGTHYGKIFFLGLPFMFASYTVYTALRGIGEAPKAMYIMLSSTLLNMGLDPLLIFRFKMGMRGAAVATVASAAVALCIGLIVLSSGHGKLRICMTHFKFDYGVMYRILSIGFPPFIESIARSLAYWVFSICVAVYGTAVVASYGICMRLMEFGIVFAVGLELGSSAVVGQNLGAKKPERAEATARNAALLALAISATISAAEVIFGRSIMGVFGRSQEIVDPGWRILVFLAIGQPLVASAIALSSAFFGSGNTWPPTIAGLLTSWLFQIPLTAASVYVFRFPAEAVWITNIVTNAIYLIILVVVFRRGNWKKMSV